MKKNNTDEEERLYTPSFVLSCIAAFLFFASTYSLLPLFADRWEMLLAFAVGMFAIGPFHAYLGDAYKRKNILFYATFLLAVSFVGNRFLPELSLVQALLLAAGQGVLFGLATTAGTTVAIDITTSTRRTKGNFAHICSTRIGMVLGLLPHYILPRELLLSDALLVNAATAAMLLSALLSLMIYVPFRSPIQMPLVSLDRFLLPRAWLPALNIWLIACAAASFMPAGIFVLLLLTIPLTRMFIKLSQHCQRGTANTTMQLSIDSGFIAGMGIINYSPTRLHLYIFIATAAASLLLYLLLTLPYYRQKRVR
jgi:MFS family permease